MLALSLSYFGLLLLCFGLLLLCFGFLLLCFTVGYCMYFYVWGCYSYVLGYYSYVSKYCVGLFIFMLWVITLRCWVITLMFWVITLTARHPTPTQSNARGCPGGQGRSASPPSAVFFQIFYQKIWNVDFGHSRKLCVTKFRVGRTRWRVLATFI